MKTFSVLFIFLFSNLVNAQNLDSTKWKGNVSYFLTDTTNAFTLEGLSPDDRWGSFTKFENGKLYAYNMGWCGNECRQMFYGSYTQKGETLTIKADSITFSGFCEAEITKVLDEPVQTFVLKEDGRNVILVRKEE